MSSSRASTAPILRTVTVRCSVEHAFRTFTEDIAAWWPVATHSMGADEGATPGRPSFRGGTAGVLEEIAPDGTTTPWARVLVWDPPNELVLAWRPNRRDEPPTEVRVRFLSEGEATRVELEHRGWERLAELRPTARDGYGSALGWTPVLERFRERADRSAANG